MRLIKYIVIHCSAGFGSIESVKRFWRKILGWHNVGYHFFIDTDGTIHTLATLNTITNGVAGYNAHAIHISYQGGVEKNDVSKAKDTRTVAQKQAIEQVIQMVLAAIAKEQSTKNIKILGHRDFSPDLDKDGIIEPWERIKECPSFDAIPEYAHLLKTA